jgi:hypothetical protein
MKLVEQMFFKVDLSSAEVKDKGTTSGGRGPIKQACM